MMTKAPRNGNILSARSEEDLSRLKLGRKVDSTQLGVFLSFGFLKNTSHGRVEDFVWRNELFKARFRSTAEVEQEGEEVYLFTCWWFLCKNVGKQWLSLGRKWTSGGKDGEGGTNQPTDKSLRRWREGVEREWQWQGKAQPACSMSKCGSKLASRSFVPQFKKTRQKEKLAFTCSAKTPRMGSSARSH
jgi:hypothetical protein